MAIIIIEFYLGRQWVKQRVFPSANPDPFMLNALQMTREDSFLHHHRVASLGDHLFLLRGVRGFEALCERLHRRTTKPSYVEAEIAAEFAKKKFEVEVVRETGIRGEDFDFTARSDQEVVSVEVTSKEGTCLSTETLKNTLSEKRSQVPPNRPAMLYIIVPESWIGANTAASHEIIDTATTKFFARSRRFNVVVVVWEQRVSVGTGQAFSLEYRYYQHPRPRYPIKNTSFLEAGVELGDFKSFIELAAAWPQRLEGDAEFAGDPLPSYLAWFEEVSRPSPN